MAINVGQLDASTTHAGMGRKQGWGQACEGYQECLTRLQFPLVCMRAGLSWATLSVGLRIGWDWERN